MARLIIPLGQTYTVHDKVFSEVVLREPSYKEIFMDGLGRPQDWQPTPDGAVVVTYPSVVDAYLQKIVVEPGYECLSGLAALDAIKLERAVCGFFREPMGSEKQPTG
ncbi:hypothetical protein [Pararhizobium sp. O133]|uniref:hypothetical protein n=1 Tax=Pararhizobium sp. O133 TaxID=3449278 RepID=UPI003F6830A1